MTTSSTTAALPRSPGAGSARVLEQHTAGGERVQPAQQRGGEEPEPDQKEPGVAMVAGRPTNAQRTPCRQRRGEHQPDVAGDGAPPPRPRAAPRAAARGLQAPV